MKTRFGPGPSKRKTKEVVYGLLTHDSISRLQNNRVESFSFVVISYYTIISNLTLDFFRSQVVPFQRFPSQRIVQALNCIKVSDLDMLAEFNALNFCDKKREILDEML